MPPVKWESDDQKAKRLACQSVELARTAQLRRILAILKQCPAAVAPCHKYLGDLGFITADGGSAPEATLPASSGSTTTKKQRTSHHHALPAPAHLAIEDAPENQPSSPAPRRSDIDDLIAKSPLAGKTLQPGMKYNSLTVSDMSALLTSMEPISLSPGNLKSSPRRVSARRLSQACSSSWLLELMTNEPPQSGIPESLKTMGHLMKHLQKVSLQFGRRARELSLPFCSMDQGIYMLSFEGGDTFVRHRFRDLPPVMIDPPKKRGVYIDMNFSEFRAVVKVLETGWQQACVVLFPASPSPKGCGDSGMASDVDDAELGELAEEHRAAERGKAGNSRGAPAAERRAPKRPAVPGAERDFKPARPGEKRVRLHHKSETPPLALENGEL